MSGRLRYPLGRWSPASEANCWAWWDFSWMPGLYTDSARTTGVAANSDPIGGVADRSGNARHLGQGTAGMRPLYKTNIVNGLSVGRGDGTDDFLTIASALPTASTVFIVTHLTSTAGMTTLGAMETALAATQLDGSPRFLIQVDTTSGWRYYNGAYNTVQATLDTSAHIITIAGNASSDEFFLDGASQGTAAPSTSDNACINLFCGFLGYYPHDIGEVVIYSSVMSAATIARTKAYLAKKWGTA